MNTKVLIHVGWAFCAWGEVKATRCCGSVHGHGRGHGHGHDVVAAGIHVMEPLSIRRAQSEPAHQPPATSEGQPFWASDHLGRRWK